MCRYLTVRRGGALSALVAVLAFHVAAVAQPAPAPAEDASLVAAARALAVEGVKLGQSNRCGEAIDKLERAEKLRHSAIVLEQLGACYIALGRYVEGTEAMHAVLRESVPEDASETLLRAREHAKSELESTKTKIAQLTITVEAAPGLSPSVTIDGVPVPAALLGVARPTDPGEHTIAAAAPGAATVERQVTLAPGQIDTVALALNAATTAPPSALDPTQPPAAALSAAAVAPPPTAASIEARPPTAAVPSSGSRVAAYVSWGVSGAALAAGLAFGWVAMNQKADLDRACPAGRCPSEQRDALDAARTNGTIATVAFATGAATAVLGTVLFFVTGGDRAGEQSARAAAAAPGSAAKARAPRPSARTSLGLSGAALQLNF